MSQDAVAANQAFDDDYSEEEMRVFNTNYERYIKTSTWKGRVLEIYNFELNDEPVAQDVLTDVIFRHQTFSFKVIASCGVILRNNQTGQIKYYYASWNNSGLFDLPVDIQNAEEWNGFLTQLSAVDYVDKATGLQRQNTNWTLLKITNITFYVFKRVERLLGNPPADFPDYLLRNTGLISLIGNNNKRYNDNLCLFRCLAIHQGAKPKFCEKKTVNLLLKYAPNHTRKTFPGVSLENLDKFETTFAVNVTVFNSEAVSETKQRVSLVRRSQGTHPSTMYVNQCQGHFSYIQDLNKYSHCYSCPKCDKDFNSNILNDHVKKCKGAQLKERFPGGVYSPKPTIAQLLEQEGICDIPEEIYFHPYRIVYDIESYFPTNNDAPPTQDVHQLTYTQEHVPLSVSICSNVPGYTNSQCIVTNGDSQQLVDKMIAVMLEIQEASAHHLSTVAEPVFHQIEQELQHWEKVDEQYPTHPLHNIKARLEGYICTIPVIGFSSGRYDINVLSKFLMKYFANVSTTDIPTTDMPTTTLSPQTQDSDDDGNARRNLILKRTNQYLMLANSKLKFLDIQNYLAPGYSYKSYLAAYECSGSKSFFPYQHITSLDKLKETALPPRESFYSDVSGTTISEQDYTDCQTVWHQKGMKSLRDWLVHYNNQDTVPFLEALEKQHFFFREQGLDMFFDAVSIPGLSDRLLHASTSHFFSLFNTTNKDLNQKFRQSVCGGPAIVFSRLHEKNITYLRTAEPEYAPHKLCQTIVGYDANSLYLKCLADPMPVGFYYRRREENQFRLEFSCSQSQVALEWLTYLANTENRHIEHMFNTGKEKRLGGKRVPVDGWDAEINSVFQFHGCYFHGHDCFLTNHMDPELRKERAENTAKQDRYLLKLGYDVRVIYECEWQAFKKAYPSEVAAAVPLSKQGPAWEKSAMPEEKIKHLILSGELFGVVEVDISVPDHLKDKFSEFCPIFKNIEVGVDDIGDHMASFAVAGGYLKKPTRCLISSFTGRQIMLITPLAKWYLEQGLQISKIQAFADTITQARREADCDPSKAIIATSKKLLGNAAYGRTLMRKDRHRDCSIVDEKGAQKAVSDPHFRGLVPLGKDLYELQMAKSSVAYDLPIQIGVFVYGYAKLRLLKFYYEFIDFYISRRDFQVVTCDTDSLYLALSGSSLEEVVKPEKRMHFEAHRDEWLPALRCSTHKKSIIKDDSATPPCCEATHKFYCREPGLWKLEAQADKIISLSPKCYICVGTHSSKVTCKGVQKKINPISFQHFSMVLHTQKSHSVVNRGFRLDSEHTMRNYIQPKRGLTYLYTKRKVLDDGVSTVPLDL